MVTQEGQEAITMVTGGGEEIPLSAVRPCRMEVRLSEALDICGNPHLIID